MNHVVNHKENHTMSKNNQKAKKGNAVKHETTTPKAAHTKHVEPVEIEVVPKAAVKVEKKEKVVEATQVKSVTKGKGTVVEHDGAWKVVKCKGVEVAFPHRPADFTHRTKAFLAKGKTVEQIVGYWKKLIEVNGLASAYQKGVPTVMPEANKMVTI